jgi:hypothetical protein
MDGLEKDIQKFEKTMKKGNVKAVIYAVLIGSGILACLFGLFATFSNLIHSAFVG